MNNNWNCNYNKSIHMSESSNKYHLQKCVINTMRKMADKDMCIKYMSGIANANEKVMDKCSIHNLNEICEKNKKDFSIEDAKKLCSIKNEASKNFWMEKNMS